MNKLPTTYDFNSPTASAPYVDTAIATDWEKHVGALMVAPLIRLYSGQPKDLDLLIKAWAKAMALVGCQVQELEPIYDQLSIGEYEHGKSQKGFMPSPEQAIGVMRRLRAEAAKVAGEERRRLEHPRRAQIEALEERAKFLLSWNKQNYLTKHGITEKDLDMTVFFKLRADAWEQAKKEASDGEVG